MQAVYNFLSSVKSHPTVEEVFNGVKEDIPTITLATVYRNLNKLFEQGKALKFEVDGEQRFDACVELHEHCLCVKCGKVLDIDSGLSVKALKDFKSQDFQAENVSVMFFGLCSVCNKRLE